ncbi:Hypothetical protein PHPALM_19047 [Phytophthora palmivora]|uniref:Uncharacterized protein n=1 Tax=Phytophthora palmivora TaxID=4796 RepID=A0A2P4XI78_9STRA|nr:Hypothetical protein PHPALM_19047 [Phytophthora palmivora]
MCNTASMQISLPSFVVDPATVSASTKPISLPDITIASCRQHSTEWFVLSSHGVSFQSEAFHLRTQLKISELVRTAAASSDECSTNALLARKALKYRRVLGRCPLVNVASVQC